MKKQVIYSALLSLSVRSFGAMAALIFSISLTRNFGADHAGLFFLSFSLMSILSVLARFGLDNSLLKFVGVYSATNKWNSVRNTMRKAVSILAVLSFILVLTFTFFVPDIASHVFNDIRLIPYFYLMSPFVFLLSLSTLLAMGLQGRHKTLQSVFLLNVSTNILMVLFIYLLDISAKELPLYFLYSSLITTILAVILWNSKLPNSGGTDLEWSMLFSSCLPLWLVMVVTQLIQWAGNISLGVWSTTSEVALFTAAQRTAMLMTFILTAINTVVAPRFAHLYKSQKLDELRSLAYYSARVLSLVSLPILIVIIVFPDFILSVFGEGFESGAIYLQIIAVGQFVNAMTGSVGYLLSMSGHEKDLRNSSLAAGIAVVLLSIVLVPTYSGLGAAISVSIAIALQNLLALHWVRKRLGINILMAWFQR
ncbi:MAG: oligosaccharide flippase family protein [Pseudoalteromonas sp.]|nr:oligosaccharide flippase family protein [Pseudoalteromonas sp.]